VAKFKEELTTTTANAAKKSAKVGSTRLGRDMLTRATYNGKAVKGEDTHGRQWERYSP
jgi:hypothetical protein